MTVVKWDPFRNIATLQGRINRLFEDAFPRSSDEEDLSACAWRPMVDIYDKDDSVIIQMDLPGVKKEDISIEIKNNLLTVSGQRQGQDAVREDRYYRRERTCGAFQRVFALHTAISPELIKASFKSGVLSIQIPYPEEEKPMQISVTIE